MRPRRRSPDRRRAVRREVFASLGLVAAIFVSILALPVGRIHVGACTIASQVAGRELPCGLGQLSVSIDPDRKPYLALSWTPLRLRDLL